MNKNHLAGEKSPYLLQHQNNPVHWWPWCSEAFEQARKEDKPIFLSIGYSTCHWCHVMKRESFEDNEIASLLNESFISIKVDKEERPDIDTVYMSVCIALTGSGGWPMSIFMDDQARPFYAGTYFPKHSRYGMIGLAELLTTIKEKWDSDRDKLLLKAQELTAHAAMQKKPRRGEAPSPESLIEKALEAFESSFDEKWGGFGRAPKFPMAHTLSFLIGTGQQKAIDMAVYTLKRLYQGGIHDHIGFGFARYSTDEKWLIPHFEKMLYDNALLLTAYTDAYRANPDLVFYQVAIGIVTFIQREMTHQNGAFFTALDADSNGVEGLYYLFTPNEIEQLLGREKAAAYCRLYDITPKGNYEGKSVPNQIKLPAPNFTMLDMNPILYDYRKGRMALHLDDKVLTGWNALMISALCEASAVFEQPQWLDMAIDAESFIDQHLRHGSGLFVSYRQGRSDAKGVLEDYAYYIDSLLRLYRMTLKEPYLNRAAALCDHAIIEFYDKEDGGFFHYGQSSQQLIARPKETHDGAMPSGNSVMASVLYALYQLTDDEKYRDIYEKQKTFLLKQSYQDPENHTVFLHALLTEASPPQKIIVVLKNADEKEKVKRDLPRGANIILYDKPTREYPLKDEQTTYYICQGNHCLPPVNTPQARL